MIQSTYEKKITLQMVFDQIPNNQLVWCILDIDVLGDFNEEIFPDKIVKEIWDSHGKKKFFLKWKEICELSGKFFDIIDFLLVGCRNEEIVLKIENELFALAKKGYPTTDKLSKIYEYLIDVDDGLLRGIYAKDQAFQDKCLKEFGPYPVPIY